MCIRDRGAELSRPSVLAGAVVTRAGVAVQCRVAGDVVPVATGTTSPATRHCTATPARVTTAPASTDGRDSSAPCRTTSVSYTHLRAHETKANLVCRLLLE